jgi:hypothetical protein
MQQEKWLTLQNMIEKNLEIRETAAMGRNKDRNQSE